MESAHQTIERLVIVNQDQCKPKKCRQECKTSCPVNRIGKLCVIVTSTDKKAEISEQLCIGCTICVKKCPFDAIQLAVLPNTLPKLLTHRYGLNAFALYNLPTPTKGKILGIVGRNGVGKSTALKVLAGKLKPNLGRCADPPDWPEILGTFAESSFPSLHKELAVEKQKAVIKPQHVDLVIKAWDGKIKDLIQKLDAKKNSSSLIKLLHLDTLIERNIDQISGGEVQRLAILLTLIQDARVYMFDEPSTYLDIRARMVVANCIRELKSPDHYVVVVDHDMGFVESVSDQICCVFGEPSVYGIGSKPYSPNEAISIYLNGFLPAENINLRNFEFSAVIFMKNY